MASDVLVMVVNVVSSDIKNILLVILLCRPLRKTPAQRLR